MDPLIWAFVLTTAMGIGMAALLVWAIASVQRERIRGAVDWGRRMLGAQEEERKVVARELHDGIVPALESLAMLFTRHGVAEGTARAASMAQHVRGLSHGLHPSLLEHSSLVDVLDDLVRDAAVEGFSITLEYEEITEPDFSHRLAAFRIAQEAVRNARRHGGATQVDITLAADGTAIDLKIHDNGCGFVVPADASLATLGLRGMRERARTLGGTLTIITAPGYGTTIHAHLPTGSPP